MYGVYLLAMVLPFFIYFLDNVPSQNILSTRFVSFSILGLTPFLYAFGSENLYLFSAVVIIIFYLLYKVSKANQLIVGLILAVIFLSGSIINFSNHFLMRQTFHKLVLQLLPASLTLPQNTREISFDIYPDKVAVAGYPSDFVQETIKTGGYYILQFEFPNQQIFSFDSSLEKSKTKFFIAPVNNANLEKWAKLIYYDSRFQYGLWQKPD